MLVRSRVSAFVLAGIAVWAVLVDAWALFLVGGAQHRRVAFWVAFVAFGLLAAFAGKEAIRLWHKFGIARNGPSEST
jgi:hypothetical protein